MWVNSHLLIDLAMKKFLQNNFISIKYLNLDQFETRVNLYHHWLQHVQLVSPRQQWDTVTCLQGINNLLVLQWFIMISTDRWLACVFYHLHLQYHSTEVAQLATLKKWQKSFWDEQKVVGKLHKLPSHIVPQLHCGGSGSLSACMCETTTCRCYYRGPEPKQNFNQNDIRSVNFCIKLTQKTISRSVENNDSHLPPNSLKTVCVIQPRQRLWLDGRCQTVPCVSVQWLVWRRWISFCSVTTLEPLQRWLRRANLAWAQVLC